MGRRQAGMRGVTLLELIMVLAIVSVITGISAPNFDHLRNVVETRSNSEHFVRLLHTARSTAITSRVITTLCPSDDQVQCGGDWHSGTILFRDNNNNRRIDNDEVLINRSYGYREGIRLNWRASAGRNRYIRFSPNGAAREFGTFTYCARSNSPRHAKIFVLNRQGRLHIAIDRDDDGVVEKRNGDEPVC